MASSFGRKLATYGVLYSLQYKLVRPALQKARGLLASARLSGRHLLVDEDVEIECDRSSSIEVGDGSHLQKRVSLRAIRGGLTQPPGHVVIGEGSTVKHDAMIFAKSSTIRLGRRCGVGRYTEISSQHCDVDIGDDVRIAGHVWIGTSNHAFDALDRPIAQQGAYHLPVRIEDDVWIGEKATILPGVTVGRGSIVAAGAVVTRDLPPFSVAGGVPAKVIKRRGAHVDEGRG